jgi:hypothetical protein
MHRVTKMSVLPDYRVELEFEDGAFGVVDLSDLVGTGAFVFWQDLQEFAQVRIGASGELVWGEEIDLCPDSIYMRLTDELRPEYNLDYNKAKPNRFADRF